MKLKNHSFPIYLEVCLRICQSKILGGDKMLKIPQGCKEILGSLVQITRRNIQAKSSYILHHQLRSGAIYLLKLGSRVLKFFSQKILILIFEQWVGKIRRSALADCRIFPFFVRFLDVLKLVQPEYHIPTIFLPIKILCFLLLFLASD